MKRIPHIIKGNKSCRLKHDWVFFDTETVSYNETDRYIYHRLRLGYAVHYRFNTAKPFQKDVFFYSGKEFKDFLYGCLRKKSLLMVASHNIAFDSGITGLINLLLQDGWIITKLFMKNRVSMVKFRRSKISICLIDTFNYFKSSVDELGKMLGLPKLHINFDTCTDDELKVYCKRDVEILAGSIRSLLSFVKDHDLGTFGITTPQQAFTAFKHKFMNHLIYIHNNNHVNNLELSAYHGGRVECFYTGKYSKPFYKLDVNSMYPYVMLGNRYPVRLRYYYRKGISVEDASLMTIDNCVVARCTVNTDKPVYPYREKKKLIFPVGTFDCYLTTPSFRYAYTQGHLVKVHKIAVYESGSIFNNYVNYFYSLKQHYLDTNNNVYKELCKLMLNSLYGKFGQRSYECEIMDKNELVMDKGFCYLIEKDGSISNCYKIADKIYKFSRKKDLSMDSFPAIASHITDYARIYLWNLIEQAGYGNILYIDTDSLIVTRKGYQELKDSINPDELGKLKLEETGKWIKIYALKDYRTPLDEKIKGISKKAQRISETEFEQLEFPSFQTVLIEDMTNYIRIEKVKKVLTRLYDKGEVQKSGWVKPYSLNSK
jgi:hypothetical protein